jgi:hypothetical protein
MIETTKTKASFPVVSKEEGRWKDFLQDVRISYKMAGFHTGWQDFIQDGRISYKMAGFPTKW